MNEVKVWEEELILPTYEIGEAAKKILLFFWKNVFIREVQEEFIRILLQKRSGTKRLTKHGRL